MHNTDSLITTCYTSKKNVQHVFIIVKKVILNVIVILKCKVIILQDLCSPSLNHDHHLITNIRCQDDHQVLMAYIGVTITISVFRITGMCPYHHSLQYLHHSICVRLQPGPVGSTSIILWTNKLIMGTPVTETLAPVIGWISMTASLKLLHLPLRYFYSLFIALLDYKASHNLISEDLVN